MVVEFDNLKLSRFKRKVPNCNDDFDYPLLLPVTFKMHIVRNMNFDAHPEVPEMKVAGMLPKFEFILSEEDYCAIMRILDENLNELPPGTHPVDRATLQPPVVIQPPSQLTEKSSHDHSDPVITTERNIKRAVRIDIAFQIDSLILDLYLKRNKEVKEGLGRLEIQVFSIKGHMFHDGSYWVDTVMLNLILDDTRVSRKSGLTRFLTKSSKSKDKLLDILYKVDQSGDFFVQMNLSKITFVYCVEFFNSFMTFYYLDNMYKQADDKRQKLADKPVASTVTDTTSPPMPPYPVRNFTVQLEMDKPDILLVANIDDPQSACIILKSSIHFKLRQVSTTQTMMAVMEELRMFTSCVDKFQEEHVRSEILKPTEISVNSTFTVENGQHMEISFSPIEIHVTAGAVEILSKSLSSLGGPSQEQKTDLVAEPDNKHIWNAQPIGKAKLWFLEERAVHIATEAMETDVVAAQDAVAAHKDEQALLNAKSIVITVEQGSENRTVPMLLWRASLEAEVLDWSSQMAVRAFLGSVVFCYNEKLAVWEPLVEPIEVPGGRKIWEIALRIDKRVVDAEEANSLDLPAVYSVELLVEDTLEVTVTQTSLQVMKHLAEAFSEALVHATYDHRRPDTPYVVRNYLGIVVHIILKGTPFRVAAPNVDEDIDEVIMEPEALVQLNFRDTGEEGEERFTGTLMELSRQNVADATFAIQVKEGGVSAVRKLCVTYADKRYFKLPIKSYPGDDWAFIVDTTSHYGSKLVMIYSVCKVVNNFSVPMEVYYLTESEGCTEVRHCGVIEPHQVLHLPVRALYTRTNELFFKPAGDKYMVSMEPFVWKSPSEAIQNSVLHCPSKTEANRFFYINVAGEKEPVKYDESSGKGSTMMLHSIQLHPTVLVRNLLPCRLYLKMENTSKLFCLEAGQSVELWNAEVGNSVLQLKLLEYRNLEWNCSMDLTSDLEELPVLIFETSDGAQMDLGMHVETKNSCLILGLYCPFWMVNKTTVDIHYKCVALWPKEVQKLELFAKYAKTEECSVPFSCKETNFVLLKIPNKKGGMYMNCQVGESAAVVGFSDYEEGLSPVLMVNHSSMTLTYCQAIFKDTCTYTLPPKYTVHYTWDNPMAKRCLLWGTEENSNLNRLDLVMDDCDQVQLKDDKKLYWIAFLNGKQRTVLFTEDFQLVIRIQESGMLERNLYDIVLNVQAVGISLVAPNPRREIVYMSIQGSGVKWESKKETKAYYKSIGAKESNLLETQYQRYSNLRRLDRDPSSVHMVNGYEVDFKQMKMMTNPKKDIRRLARPGIWASYKRSLHQSMIHAKLHMLQVGTPSASTPSKYFKILLQEFHARIDQCFINAISEFLTLSTKEEDHEELIEKDKSMTKGGLKEFAAQFSEQGIKDFFDMLHFSPIK
ncbi:hypothetical protein HPB47_006705, partial [Ixodes persulcatus]